MSIKVYLAAPYAARSMIDQYASELRYMGFIVTSSWLEEKHEINSGTTGAATELTDAEVSGHAVMDILDVTRADILVLFTAASVGMPDAKSGGRHVETGVALALKKPVMVVGEPENVFHRIRPRPGSHGWSVEVVPDWHEAVLALVSRRENEPLVEAEVAQ